MVKCSDCRYLRGAEEYGHYEEWCKHPLAEFDFSPEFNDSEKEHNCPYWCSYLIKDIHYLYMRIWSEMMERLRI